MQHVNATANDSSFVASSNLSTTGETVELVREARAALGRLSLAVMRFCLEATLRHEGRPSALDLDAIPSEVAGHTQDVAAALESVLEAIGEAGDEASDNARGFAKEAQQALAEVALAFVIASAREAAASSHAWTCFLMQLKPALNRRSVSLGVASEHPSPCYAWVHGRNFSSRGDSSHGRR